MVTGHFPFIMKFDDSLLLLHADHPVRLRAQLIKATTARACEHGSLGTEEQYCGALLGQSMARFHHTAEKTYRLLLRHGLIVEGVE